MNTNLLDEKKSYIEAENIRNYCINFNNENRSKSCSINENDIIKQAVDNMTAQDLINLC